MDDDDRNVLTFRPRDGGGAPPGLPPLPGAPPPGLPPTPGGAPPPPTAPPPPAAPPEDGGADLLPARSRRSAADSLIALSAAPPALPPVPGTAAPDATVAMREEGLAPAARDPEAPGLGALGLSAALAVALAALRGTATFVQDWRQRRMEREAENAPLREARLKHLLANEEAHAKHAAAMQAVGDKAAQKKGVPSSQEFGRKSLANGGGGRGSSGGGGGRGPAGGGKSPAGTGPGRTPKSTPTSAGSGGSTKKPSSSSSLGSTGSGKGSGGKGAGGKTAPDKPSKGVKSPMGAKGNGSSGGGTGPGRTNTRGDRAAARQGARADRRKAKQAAQLENKAKDLDAARDQASGVKSARQALKEKGRAKRIEGKQDRAEQARDARFKAKQKKREARAEAREKRKEEAAAADAGRTTLGQAAVTEARRRWNKRSKNRPTPIVSKVKKRKKKDGKGKPGTGSGGAATATPPKVDLTKKPKPTAGSTTTPPKVDLTKKPKPSSPAGGSTAPKVDLTKKPKTPTAGGTSTASPGRKKARVKPKSKTKGKTSGTGPAAGGPGPSARRKERRKDRARRASERVKAKATAEEPPAGHGSASGPGTGGTFWPPPRGERRSAYESMWAADPNQQTEWTVEFLHVPGSQERKWEPREPAVLTAGTATAAAPSISTPTKEAPVSAGSLIPSMRSQAAADHMTEVTLDDVLDALADAKDDCMETYDECAVLAQRAVKIRDALRDLADELAQRNNIIGRLTSAAMDRLAESMDLLIKKTNQMRGEALVAAESVETAHDEMHDAYRPVQQAAFDAGLAMPSARIHNED
ncbi:hypothetical protein [Streptomyces sp. NPDC058084]|uniref:hypothetical protein n=1 Tax=Streptomyces sp. NPDC058084 TaxID=3346333 RepID=UPI0036ED0955